MKKVAVTILGLVFVLLWVNSRARAQAEIDPDHYDTPDSSPAQPRDASPTSPKIHYQGNFTLPYKVRCKGKSLPPGPYLVSLDSDGKTARVTLNRKGRATRIDGVEQRPADHQEADTLVVERKGTQHELALIRISKLELVLRRTADGRNSEAKGNTSVEKLPLLAGEPK